MPWSSTIEDELRVVGELILLLCSERGGALKESPYHRIRALVHQPTGSTLDIDDVNTWQVSGSEHATFDRDQRWRFQLLSLRPVLSTTYDDVVAPVGFCIGVVSSGRLLSAEFFLPLM